MKNAIITEGNLIRTVTDRNRWTSITGMGTGEANSEAKVAAIGNVQ